MNATQFHKRAYELLAVIAIGSFSVEVRGDLEVDPCKPVLDVGLVAGLVPLDLVLNADGDSSEDGGLHESATVHESNVSSGGGSWSAFAPVRGSTSYIEPRAEFTLTWLNAHAVQITVYTRATNDAGEAAVSGQGQAAVEIPIRILPGQSNVTSATVRVQRSRHIVSHSGSTGTAHVDGIARDIRDEEYREDAIVDYVVNVGDFLPTITLSSDVDVSDSGDMVAEVSLTIEVQASDPCCGSQDPCCGNSDPCCGSSDPCCGSSDPCCGS